MTQSVLITGTSEGGLGAALAVALHKRGGYRVFATARNPAKMASLKALGIETVLLDVSSEESIAAAARAVSDATGGTLDILVNNAGGGYSMPLLDASLSEVSKQFDLNVLSILRVTQGFVHLLRASHRSGGAMLVNNTSIVSTLPVPLQGAYSASKAAAASITETLRLELQMLGIQVVELKTGRIMTNFDENLPAVHLPAKSVYAGQKDLVEKTLREGPPGHGIAATAWAESVANDLSHARSSPVIYRGGSALSGRFASALPTGLSIKDNIVKDFSGLKQIEAAYRKAS